MKNIFFLFLLALTILPCPSAWSAVSDDIEAAVLKGDYPEAERLSRDLINASPSSEQLLFARYYLGLSLLYQEKYQPAREEFQTILKGNRRDKIYGRASLGMIDILYLEGKYEKALAEAQSILKGRPDSELLSLIYLKIGRINLKLARWTQANKYLQKIIESFPNSLEFPLARQLLEEKQFFAVQVGSFLDRGHSETVMQQLQKQGQYAYIVETQDKDGTTFYRVRVGQFSSLDQAETLEKKLAGLGYPTRIYP